MDDFERELKTEFLEEASELLDGVEQAFLNLEADPASEEVINQIFRFVHNLKGTSRAVGFGEVAEFTHELENLILKIKNKEMVPGSEAVSLLLRCNDHIANMVNGLKDDLEAKFQSDPLILEIKSMIESGGSPTDLQNEVAPKEEIPEFTDSDFVHEEPAPEEVPEVQSAAPEEKAEPAVSSASEAVAKPQNWEGAPKAKSTSKPKSKSEDEYLRVALKKIEKLNNFVGELILTQTVLEQRRFHAIRDELANKSISQLTKISKEIQDISMSMRLVPLRATFQKMNRIVRDTSSTLNKKVNLNLEGQETEIDKTILENVIDPLVHIVRNAVDHGIESPEERVASGKPEQGHVTLRAYHQGNNLVIEVNDDGKGMDPRIIKEKAIEKGVLKPEQKISDQEALQLLFHPGFSTKEQVSEVSGRGVGMDVVKTNIVNLGGEVLLNSEVGKGSQCRIQLPLTLAIIDGMVAKVGEERYIFPLAQIREFLRPSREMIGHITGVGMCLSLRGHVMPVFDLSQELVGKKSNSALDDSICVVCSVHGSFFCVQVQDILNQQQIVVKALSPDIKNQKGFMGGSILGDGQPSFIVDIEELYRDRVREIRGQASLKEGA